jgi:hypothetical protein
MDNPFFNNFPKSNHFAQESENISLHVFVLVILMVFIGFSYTLVFAGVFVVFDRNDWFYYRELILHDLLAIVHLPAESKTRPWMMWVVIAGCIGFYDDTRQFEDIRRVLPTIAVLLHA